MLPPSLELRLQRESTWRELELIVNKAEYRGLEKLDSRELARFPLLLRTTSASLAVARASCLSRDVLDYLESLVARAHVLSNPAPRRFGRAFVRFLSVDFAVAVRRFLPHVGLSTAIMGLGVAVAFVLTLQDPETYYQLVPPEYAGGRDPAASTEDLLEVLYGTGDVEELSAFSSFLLSNNAKIGMMCFALGFAFGIPVVYLLFTNGLILGAFAALYHSRGLSLEFWAWILPHGVTELLAVILCGAAGLGMAQRMIFAQRESRLHALARASRELGRVVLGAVLMFCVAALIEGFFRQLVHDTVVRYTMVGLSATVLLLYFGMAGRAADAARQGANAGALG
ncbi:MAG: stage II sporulation protein M [Myxococcota bacterium]|jgi:uncharacterized membrane protein SpoIIM required for sporulation|nr:stage II sporulation protein M [Myxococcota bacterium]